MQSEAGELQIMATESPKKRGDITATALETWKGRPLRFSSSIALEEAVNQFFAVCAEKELVPTLTGLALHLGVHITTIMNYEKKDAFLPVIAKARAIIEDGIVQKLFRKDVNTAGVIFYLINMNANHWKNISRNEIDKRSVEKVEIRIKKV